MLELLRSLFRKTPVPAPVPIPIRPPVPVKPRDTWSEFGAGIGDMITLFYTSSRYNCLEQLRADEKATVLLMSHNPFAKEFFLWHRNAHQLEIKDLGFWWPKDDAERRAFHKLPAAQPFVYEVQKQCRFYPAPSDLGALRYLRSLDGYVIVSASAGGPDRNIPNDLVEKSIDVFLEAGYTVVVVGRSYGENRHEVEIRQRPDVINLVDRLTLPGTAVAVEQAAGVFCCHSSICLLAWRMGRPVFLLYPEDVKKRDFHSVHQYTIGKDFPTTLHMEFSEYNPEKAVRFVDLMGGRINHG